MYSDMNGEEGKIEREQNAARIPVVKSDNASLDYRPSGTGAGGKAKDEISLEEAARRTRQVAPDTLPQQGRKAREGADALRTEVRGMQADEDSQRARPTSELAPMPNMTAGQINLRNRMVQELKARGENVTARPLSADDQWRVKEANRSHQAGQALKQAMAEAKHSQEPTALQKRAQAMQEGRIASNKPTIVESLRQRGKGGELERGGATFKLDDGGRTLVRNQEGKPEQRMPASVAHRKELEKREANVARANDPRTALQQRGDQRAASSAAAQQARQQQATDEQKKKLGASM
jgi:hypothetical protein